MRTDICCDFPEPVTCTDFKLEDIHVNPRDLLFRKIVLGSQTKRRVSLTNMGPATVRFWLDSPSAKVFAISPVDIITLKPREFSVIEVLFVPRAIKHYLESFVIHVADEFDRSLTQTLTISLEAYPSIELQVPKVLAFGNTKMGETVRKVFTVENITECDYEIQTVCRGNYGDFCLCPNGTTNLPANSCLRLLLFFRPTRMETQTMEIGLTPLWNGIPGKQTVTSVSGFSTVKLKFPYQELPPQRHRFTRNNLQQEQNNSSTEIMKNVRIRPYDSMNTVQKQREDAKNVLDRRQAWVVKHEEVKRQEKEDSHMYRLGFTQRDQYPHNLREIILEKLIEAVDQALKTPDRKKRVEIDAWLKRNLPKDPKLQLKFATDARAEIPLEELLMTKEDLEAASKALLNGNSKSALHLTGLDESVQNVWPNDVRGVLSLTELIVPELSPEPLQVFPSTYVADFIVTLVASLLEKELSLQKVLEMFPQLRNTLKPVETMLRKNEEERAEEARKAEEEARRRSEDQLREDAASGKISPGHPRSPSKSPVKLELQHKPSARSAKEIRNAH